MNAVNRFAIVLFALSACNRGETAENASGQTERAGGSRAVQTATRPTDACGWIPAKEAEAILGSFATPPQPAEGGCRYTLVIPDSIKARRERYGNTNDMYAVDLDVDLSGEVISERAASAGAGVMGGWLRDDSTKTNTDSEEQKAPDGWDYGSATIGRPGFAGRIGHVRVTVVSHAPEISAEKIAPLAARVRDHITDLPFPLPSDRTPLSPTPDGDDPCRLLTRAEAESVLGKLVVAAYRAAKETPFADPSGRSCAYFTPGHRVLLLTPEWSYGKNKMQAVRGIGGLIGSIMADTEAEAADTLEGDWDEVAADGKTGELFFLKADRLLQIGYATSSTNSDGAVALARIALKRL